MKRFAVPLFSVLLLLLVSPSVPQAQTPVPSNLDVSEATYRELERTVTDTGSINLMVGLDVEFRPEGHLPDSARKRQRRGIRRAQNAVLSALSDTNVSKRRQYRTIPWLSLTVNETAFRALSRIPFVQTLKEVTRGEALLKESVPQVEGDTIQAGGTRGDNQVVAVLDSGLDIDHPAFDGKIRDQACFSTENDCPNGDTVQTTGDAGVPIDGVAEKDRIHGTHVGGIAVGKAVPSLNLGSGVAPQSGVIPIMVFSDNKESNDSNRAIVDAADPLAALDYLNAEVADDLNLRAVNMSLRLDGSHYSSNCDGTYPGYKDAIDSLGSKGVATFVASGNEDNHDAIRAPACVSTAVAVGATDTGAGSESLWTETSLGTDRHPDLLDLLAPGVGIKSAVPGNSTETLKGTSLAAPHAAGGMALLQSRESTVWDTDVLLDTMKDSGNIITDGVNGETYPSIRLAAACDSFMGSGDLGSNCYPAVANITSPPDGSAQSSRQVTVNVDIVDADSGDDLRLFRNDDVVVTDDVTGTSWSPTLRLVADTNELEVDIRHNGYRTNTDTSTVTLDQDLSVSINSPDPGFTSDEPPLKTDGDVKGLEGDTLLVFLDDKKAPAFAVDSAGTLLDWSREFDYETEGDRTLTAELRDRDAPGHVLLKTSLSVTTNLPQTGSVDLTADFRQRRDNNEVKTFAAEESFGVMFISGSGGWTSYSEDPSLDPGAGEFLAVDHPDMQTATIEVMSRNGDRVYRRTVQGRTRIRWDGVDDSGRTVSNGLYVVRIEVTLSTTEGSSTSTKVFPVMVVQ